MGIGRLRTNTVPSLIDGIRVGCAAKGARIRRLTEELWLWTFWLCCWTTKDVFVGCCPLVKRDAGTCSSTWRHAVARLDRARERRAGVGVKRATKTENRSSWARSIVVITKVLSGRAPRSLADERKACDEPRRDSRSSRKDVLVKRKKKGRQNALGEVGWEVAAIAAAKCRDWQRGKLMSVAASWVKEDRVVKQSLGMLRLEGGADQTTSV